MNINNWNNKITNIRLVDRDQYLVSQAAGKRVLHLGCTDSPFTENRISDGSLLHLKLDNVAEYVIGVDIDLESLNLLKDSTKKSTFLHSSIEDILLIELVKEHKFDLIICADVIEHLNNVGLMLSNCESILDRGSKLIITTINSSSFKASLRAIFNREAVHPDHVSYYSFATLSHIVSRFGFQALHTYSTFLYPFQNKILNRIQPFFYRKFPLLSDGLIFEAVKK